MKRFEEHIVLVTGGNSGIGLATARAFAAEGASVVITGRDPSSLDRAARDLGPDTLAVRADVTRNADLDRLYALIRERHGRIDVLFANAGVARFAPAEAVTEAMYDDIMSTNVRGLFFTLQKALPLLAPGGAVILNGSVTSELSNPAANIYGASKAAVRSIGRTFGAAVLERGIRVNVISPGPIETPIYGPTPGLLENLASFVPMKRYGAADEVARAVLFLASRDASYITGVDLPIDGGVMGLG
ncbi:MAG TPA: SDR family oxidoreductase [Thermoanaerobaculia bacterium]|nr:SDR family oxidoreductase [Thermoanaerobaculia bacterium]